jgi:CheY-like chemotaxis protein
MIQQAIDSRPPPVAVSVQPVSARSAAAPLVVAMDDDPGLLALYREVFEADGLAVHVASEPLSLDAVRHLHPDVIVLECRFAGADGCSLLRQVRQDPELRYVPCVVCTGSPRQAQDMAQDLAAWDVPVLAKPFDLAELRRTVRCALQRVPIAPEPVPNPELRLTPQALARLHDRYVSALWRGDDVDALTVWLGAHWTRQAPPEPAGLPSAVSCLGRTGIGGGMRWYHQGTAILGYPSRSHPGCYRISQAEVPPAPPGLRHGGYP